MKTVKSSAELVIDVARNYISNKRETIVESEQDHLCSQTLSIEWSWKFISLDLRSSHLSFNLRDQRMAKARRTIAFERDDEV
jgi:hypothetical protein